MPSKKSLKILLLGDSGIDHWVYGECKRLSPEAPVPVLLPRRETINDSMAANVYNNLKSLYNDLEIIFPNPSKEITKTRYVDIASKQHIIRVDKEDSIKSLTFPDVLDYIEKVDAIVISDYNKGSITYKFIKDLCFWAEVPIFIDTKKPLGEWSKDINFVKINEKEYEATKTTADNCQNLIVTFGEKGSTWINKSITVPTEPVAVADTCGAGDSYLAGFVISYLLNNDTEQAMKDANKVAGLAVSKPGVVAVDGKGIFY